MTSPWGPCPNEPRCAHSAATHDIAEYDDPRPMCCVPDCTCGKEQPCPACGTNHDGYAANTLGGTVRCLRAQVAAIEGDNGPLVDQIDTFMPDLRRRQAAFLGLPFLESAPDPSWIRFEPPRGGDLT
jgi:hypothetical protein